MKILHDVTYGADYKAGYVFFSHKQNNIAAHGVALLTEYECKSGISVSHCGVISGKNTCIEAAPSLGVRESNFRTRYLEKSDTLVLVKKPIGYIPELASTFVSNARVHIGKGYAFDGVVGSILFVLLSRVGCIPYIRKYRNPFNPRRNMFCSELVAKAMQDTYSITGCLQWHSTNIYPQTLFEDQQIWTPWRFDIIEQLEQEGRVLGDV